MLLLGFLVEAACAAIQFTALIITVAGGSYSREEIAAAYLTVIVDAFLLIAEAFMAWRLLEDTREKENLIQYQFPAVPVLGATIVTAVGLTGLPTFVAKLRGRSLTQFKFPAHAQLMLSLRLLAGLAGAGLASFIAGDGWMQVIFKFCGMLYLRAALVYSPFVLAPCLLIAVLCVSLTLGILILTSRDTISLSLLVVSNLYPALLTDVVMRFRYFVEAVYGQE